jgi:hypothetical protein
MSKPQRPARRGQKRLAASATKASVRETNAIMGGDINIGAAATAQKKVNHGDATTQTAAAKAREVCFVL